MGEIGPNMKLERHRVFPPGVEVCPEEDTGTNYWFWCDGCDTHHVFTTKLHKGQPWSDPKWDFDGNMESPTFSPSLRVRSGSPLGQTTCHLFLRKGMVQYLNDCTHHLKGQTVPVQKPQ